MNDRLAKAKKIFWLYGGIHQHIARENYEHDREYRLASVSKEQEQEWAIELKNELFEDAYKSPFEDSSSFYNIVDLIQEYTLEDALVDLVLKIDKEVANATTMHRLLYLERILNATRYFINENFMCERNKNILLDFLTKNANNISNGSNYSITELEKKRCFFPGEFSNEAIKKRIYKLREKLNEIIS